MMHGMDISVDAISSFFNEYASPLVVWMTPQSKM